MEPRWILPDSLKTSAHISLRNKRRKSQKIRTWRADTTTLSCLLLFLALYLHDLRVRRHRQRRIPLVAGFALEKAGSLARGAARALGLLLRNDAIEPLLEVLSAMVALRSGKELESAD
jgi:hypothetical protein